MIGPLQVVVDPRPQRWTLRLIDALNACGVETSLTNHPLAGEALLDLRSATARTGAPAPGGWYLEIGHERGGVPAFEEGRSGARVVGVTLGVRNGERLYVVRYGRFPYVRHHSRTLALIVAQCASWIRDELLEPTPIARCPLQNNEQLSSHRLTFWERLLFAAREVARVVKHAVRFAFEEVRWEVAVTNTPIDRFLDDPKAAWLHWIARDRSEFLADPFIAAPSDGPTRLLCETMTGGSTSIVSIDLNDRFGARTPLLPNEGASSYPYVFEVGEELWLVPEQRQRRAIHAYRLNGKVEPLEAPIHEGIAAVDPTIVQHEGLWWLFCADQDDAPNHSLRIFWAHEPRGPWKAHARNPAKIDISGARPAGNFFMRDGVLHRPAQDCTGRYGQALAIQRIDVLTPQEFHETTVARIDASILHRKGAIGTHTLSYGDGWVALDAQFARWSLRKSLRILRGERS